MGIGMFDYLIQTVLNLALLLGLLRLLLQLTRADFYNPLSQFVVKYSNPLLSPLRRLIPGFWGGIDWALVLLLVLLQVGAIAAPLLLHGQDLPAGPLLFIWALIGLLGLLVNFYFFAILAHIVLSWVAPASRHPAVHLLYQLTEVVMAPCRRLLPPMGGLDLSPILLFIGFNILLIALRHAAASVGLNPALVLGL